MIIPGYDRYRADHPSNVKRGGICIYYKKFFPLKVTNIQYLQECINFEMKIGDKLCNLVALYPSPSQSQDEFEKFSKNLELNLDIVSPNNPFLTVVIGDFNAKSNLWYKNDNTKNEGSKFDGIASQFGLHQLINEPTHLTRNASSCIDLIFTSQQNLVMESGVHSSLHENCHHQITWQNSILKIQSFRGKDVLQIVMSTRKCTYLTKPLRTWFPIIFLMKQLFVMIGIHLGLIKISKNLSMIKTMHTNLIVKMKITPLLFKNFNYFNPN